MNSLDPVRFCRCGARMTRRGDLYVCATGTCDSIRFAVPIPPRPPAHGGFPGVVRSR